MWIFSLGHRELCHDSENHSPDVTEVWDRPSRDGAAQWRPVHQRPAHSTHWQTQQPQGDLVHLIHQHILTQTVHACMTTMVFTLVVVKQMWNCGASESNNKKLQWFADAKVCNCMNLKHGIAWFPGKESKKTNVSLPERLRVTLVPGHTRKWHSEIHLRTLVKMVVVEAWWPFDYLGVMHWLLFIVAK